MQCHMLVSAECLLMTSARDAMWCDAVHGHKNVAATKCIGLHREVHQHASMCTEYQSNCTIARTSIGLYHIFVR